MPAESFHIAARGVDVAARAIEVGGWTEEGADAIGPDQLIGKGGSGGAVVGSQVLVKLLVNRLLLEVRQDVAIPRDAGGPDRLAFGKGLLGIVIAVQGQADLLHVVLTLRARGRLAHLLHGRHQQGDEDRDDGNHDQQFDESESGPSSTHRRTSRRDDTRI
jgi:hypothetical protein